MPGTFEIDEPKRIVYTDAFSDTEGNIDQDKPVMQITVTFVELPGGRTRLTSAADCP